ncbi:MAG: FtsX-like permease family protein [Clostridia bacterium]|nr:FtsX-like permease family protein [Clostridia bacterium]
MSFRLALKNVRRSIRDYLVYFVTLTLSVCIFYMFNSLDAQIVMLDIAEYAYATTILSIIRVVSVLVAVVLAFLILYANGFILRRRKREIGLYMLLGLSARRTAGVLMLETLMLGLLALGAGLAAGYLASQGMSVLTAGMLGVTVSDYHFVFSPPAMTSTCIYFGITFLIVMLFNARSVSRQPLSELLRGGQVNERLKIRRRWVAALLTGLGVFVVAISYWAVFYFGIGEFAVLFGPAILVNFAGTLLLFYGLSGFMLTDRGRTWNRQLRGLRLFAERQLLSRVNTNAVSMTFICTMVFMTLVIVSTVSSVNTAIEREDGASSPADVSLTAYQADTQLEAGLLREHLEASGVPIDMFAAWAEFLVYETEVPQGELADASKYSVDRDAQERFALEQVGAISVSAFNQAAQMQGREPISLPDGTYALDAPLERIRAILTAVPGGTPIQAGGRELVCWDGPVQAIGLWTTAQSTDRVWLILPDDVTETLPVYVDVFSGNFAVPLETGLEIMQRNPEITNSGDDGAGEAFPMYLMAVAAYQKAATRSGDAAVVFVGLYVGMIFLVAGAAILALQQLSGAADDRPGYALLSKLGADRRMIEKALLWQMAAYFFLPLGVGAVHSIFGIAFVTRAAGVLGYGDIATGAATAALFILAIYGAYFAAAYAGACRIVRARHLRQE